MADTEQLLITLGVDSKGTTQQISAVNKEIRALDKEFKSANAISKDFEKSTEGLKTKLGYLEKSFTANNTKLDSYKNKMQEAKDAIAKKQAELEKLNSAEEVNEKAVGKANEQLEKMKNTLRTTEQNISLTENEMKRLTNEINDTNSALKNEALDTYKKKMQDLGENIQGTGGKIKNVGDSVSGAGVKLLALSAPLVAVGVVAAKVGMDFDSEMSRVKAISGATGDEFEKLKKQAIDLGGSTAFSAKEAAEGMENLGSAGFTTTEIMSAMPGMLDLAASSGEDLASSADIAASTLRGFGLEAAQAGHVADVLAKNAGATNAAVADTGEAMKYIAPVAHAMGLSLEEVTASIGIMANAGIKGSQAGTTLRGALTKLASPSKEAAGLMQGLAFEAFDTEGKLLPLSGIITNLKSSLSDLTDEGKQNAIATIFGQEAMSGILTLVDAGPEQLDQLTNSLKKSDGAASDMAKTMQDNAKSSIEQMFGSLETAGIKLEEGFAPTIRKAADSVGELADKFSKLSPKTQESIVEFTALTVATGGILTIGGKVISGVGSMVTGFGKLTTILGGSATEAGIITSGLSGLSAVALPLAGVIAGVAGGVYLYTQNQDAMSKSVVTSSEELGTLQTALTELNGVHVSSRAELEKSGLVYKKLGDDLGEDFKKKVEESTKKIAEFNFNLGLVNVDGVVTKEEADGLTSRVNDMANSALNAIKSKSAETQSELSKMFLVKDEKIDESEKKVLEFVNSTGQKEIEEITKLKADVQEIYKKAVDNKRDLNEQEIKDVQEKLARISQIELEATANNQAEQLYAKNQFTERIKTVDAETASQMLVERKKAIEDETTNLLANYQTQLDLLAQQKKKAQDQGDTEAEANIQAQIDIKTKEKDGIIDVENKKWEETKKVMDEQQPALIGKYNEYTGAELSAADIHAQNMLELFKKNSNGLEEITETGWYNIKDKITGAVQNCYVEVDKNTGQIVGAWNNCTQKSGGYTDALDEKVREVGKTHSDEQGKISSALITLTGAWGDASGQITSHGGQIIGTMHDVTTATDGTKQGIIDVNGTPMDIKTNSKGTIIEINGVKSSVDEIPKEPTVTISFFQKGLDAIKSVWDTITDAGVTFNPNDYDHNDVGTYNYAGGISTIDEKGWELASNNNVSILGSYGGNSLASISSGTGIRTHMQSVEDMKAEISKQISSLMLSGSFYDRDSLQSTQLVNNSNVSNNYSNGSNDFDYNQFANIMSSAMTNAFSNMNIAFDANGIVTKSVNTTMDKLKRNTKNNIISKGR